MLEVGHSEVTRDGGDHRQLATTLLGAFKGHLGVLDVEDAVEFFGCRRDDEVGGHKDGDVVGEAVGVGTEEGAVHNFRIVEAHRDTGLHWHREQQAMGEEETRPPLENRQRGGEIHFAQI